MYAVQSGFISKLPIRLGVFLGVQDPYRKSVKSNVQLFPSLIGALFTIALRIGSKSNEFAWDTTWWQFHSVKYLNKAF